MDYEGKEGREIAEWFETFLKVVCWEYHLEPSIPYHDISNRVVSLLGKEGRQAKDLPWRKIK